jgi:hypothetical protein
MTVSEIEAAIVRLKPNEIAALQSWLNEYQARLWDAQIENDLESGRLDALIEEAEGEYQAGLGKPL